MSQLKIPATFSLGLKLLLVVLLILITALILVSLLNSSKKPPVSQVKRKQLEILAYFSYANVDEAHKSLIANRGLISELSPSWYRFDNQGNLLGNGYDPDIAKLLSPQTRLLPLLSNYDPQTRGASQSLAHDLFINPSAINKLIDNLIKAAKDNHYFGYNLDIEGIDPADRQLFNSFLKEIYGDLNAANLKLYISVPAKVDSLGTTWSQAFNYEQIAKFSDYIIVMGYNESWSTGKPGPIESTSHLSQVVNQTISQIPRKKILVGISVYGLDWEITSGKSGVPISYSAIDSKLQATKFQVTKQDGAAMINYSENNLNHIIWYEDAETVTGKIDALQGAGLNHVAFWSIGREDRKLWDSLSKTYEIKTQQ